MQPSPRSARQRSASIIGFYDDITLGLAFLRLPDPPDWLNVGTGVDVTIRDLTAVVAEATGFRGKIVWDASKPDGSPRKLLEVGRLAGLGWRARIDLKQGVAATYASFLEEKSAGTLRT